MASAAIGQPIVNIDATTNNDSNPVPIFLSAGNYLAVPFDNSGGGGFIAWSAWSTTTGCDAQGANCSTGWLNTVRVQVPGQPLASGGQGVWETEALALANAVSVPFNVPSDANVDFFISDNVLTDNRGGMSVRIEDVPATPEIPTLGSGGILLLILLVAGIATTVLRRG